MWELTRNKCLHFNNKATNAHQTPKHSLQVAIHCVTVSINKQPMNFFFLETAFDFSFLYSMMEHGSF